MFGIVYYTECFPIVHYYIVLTQDILCLLLAQFALSLRTRLVTSSLPVPVKLEVWATCWYQCFGTPFFSLNNIAVALLRLEFPPLLTHVVHLDPGAIVGACLLDIWRCHWSLIYSNVPFLPLSVFSQVSSLISRSSQEHLMQQGLSSLLLPHFHI
jgi:hypothetical protein